MKFCPAPGCRVKLQAGRCEIHTSERQKRHDAARRDQAHRAQYRTERWKRYSLRRLAEFPLCVLCESQGILKLAEVTDHVKPASLYPERFWEASNHQSLCAACNRTKGNR